MGASQGTSTTSQVMNTNMGPWNDQAPYLRDIFGHAATLYNNTDPQYYPGKTVSPFTDAQNTGYRGIIDKATAGSPLMPAMQDTALRTLQGGYLDPSSNPWLKSNVDAAMGDVTRHFQTATAPQTAGGFASAGRYGSGSYANAAANDRNLLGQNLGRVASNMYGENYAAERNRQFGAMNNIEGLLRAGYLEPTALVNAGAAQQGQNQRELSDEVARWNVEKNPASKWGELSRFYSILGANNWGRSGTSFGTSAEPYFENVPMQIAGLVLGAGKTAGSLGWSPFG